MDGFDDPDGDVADASDDGGDDGDWPTRRRWWPVVLAAAVVLGAGIGLGVGLISGGAAAPSGPEGVPIQQVPDLAPASTTASGAPVDGITCRTSTQQNVKYHIHIHVNVFVNGHQERLPAGAGIPAPQFDEHLASGLFIDNGVPDGCLYWLHIHANDGIVHVEAPSKQTFTLGQFFDIWGQPLSASQVGPATGIVTAFENGARFTGDPRDIPLLPHSVIQLDVGSPVVAFVPVDFDVIGLCATGVASCAS